MYCFYRIKNCPNARLNVALIRAMCNYDVQWILHIFVSSLTTHDVNLRRPVVVGWRRCHPDERLREQEDALSRELYYVRIQLNCACTIEGNSQRSSKDPRPKDPARENPPLSFSLSFSALLSSSSRSLRPSLSFAFSVLRFNVRRSRAIQTPEIGRSLGVTHDDGDVHTFCCFAND